MRRVDRTDANMEMIIANIPLDPLAERIASHLRRLSVEIGSRPGGSPANRAAAAYIRDAFQTYGLAVEMQEFACPAWEDLETRLEVDGAPLAAAANNFSPPCDVTAPSLALGTIAQLEAADLSGRVAILYGDLSANVLSPKGWFLKSERDDRVIRLLEEKKPAALITVQQRLGELERIIQDPDFILPSATVPPRAGLALMRSAGRAVHLRLDTRREEGCTWNIVGRRAGATGNKIVLCAHYDSNHDTPGALDNAGGVATMLALAEQLSGQDHLLGLECIAFGNEDSMPEGTEFYVRAYEQQFGQIVALFNFDGVGHALDVDTVAMMAESPRFRDLVDGVKRAYPALLWKDPWPESNHSAFAWRGVPCLAFTSPAGSYLCHLRCDTIEWASPAKLAELVQFVGEVVEALQGREPAWTRAPGQ